MAKIKYKVKAGDTFASLGNPQEIMALNPGVPKLSQGQTIFLPSFQPTNYAAPQYSTPAGPPKPVPYGPPKPVYGPALPVSSSFISGAGQVYKPPTVQTLYSPDKIMPVAKTQLPTGSFVSGGGQVNTQDDLQMMVNGSVAQSAPPAASTTPTGTYTGGNSANDQAWRNYWNQQAAAGRNQEDAEPTVRIPTRGEIWEMKAAQRRKQMGKKKQPTAALAPSGNAVNSSTSWRVG